MTPEDGFFLDVGDVLAHGRAQSTSEFLHWLANQVQDDAARSKHVRVLRFRRWMIKAQIACIVAGAFVIVAAVVATLPTSP